MDALEDLGNIPFLGSIERLVTDPARESDQETWTLYYYPLRNRGNFVRLLFAMKDQDYTEIRDMDEIKRVFAAWDGLNSIAGTNDGDESKQDPTVPPAAESFHTPPFALPGVTYIEPDSGAKTILSQVTVIVPFVASKLDLAPAMGSNDDFAARKLLCDCNDVVTEIYSIADGGFRKYRLEDVKPYFDTRLEKWLTTLEIPLERKMKRSKASGADNDTTSVWYFGDNITYADLAVFNLIDALFELMKEKIFYKVFDKHKSLLQLYENVAQLKQVKELLEMQKKENWPWFSEKSQINQKIYPKLKQAYGL